MASKVFGRKREYRLTFNKEHDGYWYIDFPGWPFEHGNLMMVQGADKLCDFLANDNVATVDVIPSNTPKEMPGYACLVQKDHSLTGGSTYSVEDLRGFSRDIWLCPVTLFVLGHYPKYIYIKKSTTEEL